MDFVEDQILKGILKTSNLTRQKLGMIFAKFFHLEPGPPGKDGGVDGKGEYEGKKIYFQSKLSKKKIGVGFARDFESVFRNNNFDIGLYIAGDGYTKPFIDYIEEYIIKKHGKEVILLTIYDIYTNSEKLKEAFTVLPQLEHITDDIKKEILRL